MLEHWVISCKNWSDVQNKTICSFRYRDDYTMDHDKNDTFSLYILIFYGSIVFGTISTNIFELHR